jgi:hypothetical protein
LTSTSSNFSGNNPFAIGASTGREALISIVSLIRVCLIRCTNTGFYSVLQQE